MEGRLDVKGSARDLSPSADAATPKSAAPDLATLYRNERAGEFSANVFITGTARITVNADSREDALRKIEAMIDNGEIEISGDGIGDAQVSHVAPSPTMYLVKRDGQEMGVSHVKPGDEPTTPTSTYMAATYLPPGEVVQS